MSCAGFTVMVKIRNHHGRRPSLSFWDGHMQSSSCSSQIDQEKTQPKEESEYSSTSCRLLDSLIFQSTNHSSSMPRDSFSDTASNSQFSPSGEFPFSIAEFSLQSGYFLSLQTDSFCPLQGLKFSLFKAVLCSAEPYSIAFQTALLVNDFVHGGSEGWLKCASLSFKHHRLSFDPCVNRKHI